MARKVNKKFLFVLVGIVGALAVAGVGVMVWRHHRYDPKRLMANGAFAEKNGDYLIAAQNYRAAGILLRDAKIITQAGDVFNRLTYIERGNLNNAMQCWQLAVSTDPSYEPALQRQLDYWQTAEKLEGEKPDPGLFDRIREMSQKILALDPKNMEARVAGPVATIDSWVHRIDNDQNQIDAAIKDLRELQQEDPTNAKIPFYIAAAYNTEAERAVRDNRPEESDRLLAQARQVMVDALKNNDNNAEMHLMAARIYLSEPVSATQQDKVDAKKKRVNAEIARASQLVKPDDPDYDDIQILAATIAPTPAESEKIYRDMLKQRPDDLLARVRLAELIAPYPNRRDEAIEMLSHLPSPSVEQQSGPIGLRTVDLMGGALASLTNMRLDKAMSTRSKSEQDALMPQIESDFKKLTEQYPDSVPILRIQAKIQIIKDQITDAIATLTQALPKADERSAMHYELMYLSAKCYLETNQTGSAKLYLQQIVNDLPTYDDARILLTQTELQEFDFDAAEKNLAVLEKSQPDNVKVIQMRIAVLQGEKQPDKAKAIYATLPEDTRDRQLNKATIATLMGFNDEAKRLLEATVKANPGDINAVMMLSGLYARNKDNAAATAVLDNALKASPNNPDLLLARAKIGGSSADEMQKIRLQEAAKISDPLERELALFQLTSSDADENTPMGHLQAAEKINPKDQRVLSAMFGYHVRHHNWDQANNYANALAAIDADQVKGALYHWKLLGAQAAAATDSQTRDALAAKALDLATQLTHDYPEFAQSWICLGQTMEAVGRYEEAIPNFESAKEKQPSNPEPYQGLIDCYYHLNRADDAGTTIAEAVQTLPQIPAFKEMQLQHELNYGNPEKVVKDREQAVKDAPDSPEALMTLAQTYWSVARNKSAKPETEKDAATWFDKARSTLADGASKFPDVLEFTTAYGELAEQSKHVDEGEKLWKSALALPQWKDKPVAVAGFADFYVRANRPADAEKLLRDYLASPTGKNDPDITLKLADLLSGENKLDDALAVVQSLPNDPRLQYRRIELLITQGKFVEAEKSIQSQSQQTPESQASLAYIYLNTNRVKQAMDLLNNVIATNPRMSGALYFRALGTLRTPGANLGDAIADLTQVRDLTPGNMQARYMLADCYLRTNDSDSAIRELEGIVRANSMEKAARIKLLDLYSRATPPQWLDADRLARAGDAIPLLAADPEYLVAEARMYSKKDDTDRAVAAMKAAMKADPKNILIVRNYYGVLIQGKMYQQVMDESDALPKQLQDQSWVHAARGSAQCKLGNKDAGLQEYVAALKTAFAAKDQAAADQIVAEMASVAGADSALKVVSNLPQANEPRWMLTSAWLEQKKNDVATARKTVDKVLANLDKLSHEEQVSALGFAGSLYMQTPDPDLAKARDIDLKLLKLTPDDYRIYNNLACNTTVSSADSLDYSRKAFSLMQQQHTFEPLVADTYGWSLVQSGDDRNLDEGLNVLLDAWTAREIPDTAYHLGKAYLKKNNATEAEKYLAKVQTLFDEALKNNEVMDATLQQSIVDAQNEASKLKGRQGS